MLNANRAKFLLGTLIRVTGLVVFTQIAFFVVHYRMNDILDKLAGTSIGRQWLDAALILPILGFFSLQLLAYGSFVSFIWFVAVSWGELLDLSQRVTYWLGLMVWLIACICVFTINQSLYPHSFFAEALNNYVGPKYINEYLLPFSVTSLLLLMGGAWVNFFYFRRFRFVGWLWLALIVWAAASAIYSHRQLTVIASKDERPNIIMIGLDSVRPDHIHYFGNQQVNTPTIDAFLQKAAIFSDAYSPLARTFPSWVSLLTAKFPLHDHARMNLQNPQPILKNEMLTKRLRAQGYYTIYGTDEVRFSDITKAYGFDRVIRPTGGAAGFLIETLQDFPLTNLLVNLSIGKTILPYNYGNRGAHITYQPNSFLTLVQQELMERPNKPLFLAIHLCLTHWPFTWSQDGDNEFLNLNQRYINSINAEDKQLSALLSILKAGGLLEHSIVMLMSDHGVTLGLPNDRITREENYRGSARNHKSLIATLLDSAPPFPATTKKDFVIHTSYGQGTDVLSLKQYHVLLAFQGYGLNIPAHQIHGLSSLLDVAPTLLEYLHLPAFEQADGKSLLSELLGARTTFLAARPFYLETGDKFVEMEQSKIDAEKVFEKGVDAYRLDKGYLILKPELEASLIKAKQRAVIYSDWLFAHYPEEMRNYMEPTKSHGKRGAFNLRQKAMPSYYVLVNLESGLWTTDLTSSFARSAPLTQLSQQLHAFYGKELSN